MVVMEECCGAWWVGSGAEQRRQVGWNMAIEQNDAESSPGDTLYFQFINQAMGRPRSPLPAAHLTASDSGGALVPIAHAILAHFSRPELTNYFAGVQMSEEAAMSRNCQGFS